MGWWIALGILILVAAIPFGVSIHYDADGLDVKAIVSFIRFTVFPLKKKQQKKEKATPPAKKVQEKTNGTKTTSSSPVETNSKTKGGSLNDFLPFVKLGLEFLDSFRKRVRLNQLKLNVVLAGEDPCDLAILYGRAWTAIGNLMPRLERVFVIGKRDIEIGCDFTAAETLVTAHLDITITVGRAACIAAVYGFRALLAFLKFMKKRKDGASI